MAQATAFWDRDTVLLVNAAWDNPSRYPKEHAILADLDIGLIALGHAAETDDTRAAQRTCIGYGEYKKRTGLCVAILYGKGRRVIAIPKNIRTEPTLSAFLGLPKWMCVRALCLGCFETSLTLRAAVRWTPPAALLSALFSRLIFARSILTGACRKNLRSYDTGVETYNRSRDGGSTELVQLSMVEDGKKATLGPALSFIGPNAKAEAAEAFQDHRALVCASQLEAAARNGVLPPKGACHGCGVLRGVIRCLTTYARRLRLRARSSRRQEAGAVPGEPRAAARVRRCAAMPPAAGPLRSR